MWLQSSCGDSQAVHHDEAPTIELSYPATVKLQVQGRSRSSRLGPYLCVEWGTIHIYGKRIGSIISPYDQALSHRYRNHFLI